MINMVKIAVPVFVSLFGIYTLGAMTDTPDKPEIRKIELVMENPKRPYITLDIFSEPLEKNIFHVSGFEDGDTGYTYRYSNFPEGHHRRYGGQTRVTEDKSEGFYSTKIVDTYTNGNYDKGNDANGIHKGYAPYSILRYEDRVYLPDNAYLSVTADVKTDSKAIFTSTGTGGRIDKPEQWGKRVFKKDAKKGDTVIYISGVDSELDRLLQEGSKMYIALNDTETGDYEYGYIKSLNIQESSVTLSKPLNQDFKEGDAVLEHAHINPVEFPKIEVEPTKEWKTIQLNAIVDSSKYTTSKRGIEYWWETETAGTAYVDNIRFGYANKIRITKDDEIVYEGYDMTYKDREVRDYKGPEKISSIQTSRTLMDDGNYKISIDFDAPEDRGTEYRYKVQAMFEDKISDYSEEASVTALSGIEGYSYVINSDPDGSPDDVIDTVDTTITEIVPNQDKDLYIHIRAYDKAGNPSRTLRKKIQSSKTDLEISKINELPKLDISFPEHNTGEYRYSIFRNENGGEFSEIVKKSTTTTYTDNTAIDKNAPNTPNIDKYTYNSETNMLDFNVNETLDVGTKYSYYVETYSLDGELVSTSNIVNFEAKSGIKGISFDVLTGDDINVDDNIDNINSNKISVPINNGSKYLVAKSIDNKGNISEILKLEASDNEKPKITLRTNSQNITKDDVVIMVSSSDNIKVDSIILPDGSVIKDSSFRYSVSTNGTYSFGVKDISGNVSVGSIEILNIDKKKPTLTITKDPNTEWSNVDVNVTIEGED